LKAVLRRKVFPQAEGVFLRVEQKAFRTEVGFVFARRNQPGPVLKKLVLLSKKLVLLSAFPVG
jgi:hypothetical protein